LSGSYTLPEEVHTHTHMEEEMQLHELDLDLSSTLLDSAFPSTFKDPPAEAEQLPAEAASLVAKVHKEKRGIKRRRSHGRAISDPEALRHAANTLAADFDLSTVSVAAPSSLLDINLFDHFGSFGTEVFTNELPTEFNSTGSLPTEALNLFAEPLPVFAEPAPPKTKKRRKTREPAPKKLPKPTKKQPEGERAQGSIRGKYTCGRCGQPKEGHVCPVPDARSIATQVDLSMTKGLSASISLLSLSSSYSVLDVSKQCWNSSCGRGSATELPLDWGSATQLAF